MPAQSAARFSRENLEGVPRVPFLMFTACAAPCVNTVNCLTNFEVLVLEVDFFIMFVLLATFLYERTHAL